MKPYNIGIDLGGSKAEVILLDPEDREVYRDRVATPPEEKGYEAVVRALVSLIESACAKIPEDQECGTIGVGIPGAVNRQTGLVKMPNLPHVSGHYFQKDLEDALNRSVQVENDANCFVLAESLNGAAREYNLVFGIILGTGCGGGLCINRSIWQGANGIAGEWGHFVVDPQGDICGCGNRGCIETKIGGYWVERNFYNRYERKLRADEIARGYREGDSQCVAVFEAFLEDYGKAVGGLISTLDPDAIVIGGGLSGIEELYTIGVDRVKAYAYHPDIQTPILKNKLGDSAGVYGAAWLGESRRMTEWEKPR